MQSISQWFINDFVPAFGRTLVHSLWQGVAAAILAGLVIAFTRKSSAAKRYNGLLAVYALFIITVSITCFYELGSSATITATPTAAGMQPLAIVVIENGVSTSQVAEQNFMNNILSLVNQYSMLLVGLWALLFIAQLTCMALGLRYVQTVKRQGISSVSTGWSTWINKMSSRIGITQNVVLLQSQKIKVPVALGILKPIVLIPVGLLTQLTTQQVEAVLLHELAHIRRKDYLVNLIQSFADAVFFFNPAVRWISSRIREERETCCDDIVMQHTTNKKDYVEALVSFSQMPLSPGYAMAIGSNKNHLLNRVKTIITRENSRLSAKEQATLMLGMIAILAIGFQSFKPKEKEIINEVKSEQKISTETKPLSPTTEATQAVYKIKSSVKKSVTDTIPATKKKEPIKWKNVSTNINDDEEGKTMQVLATAEDGTAYRIRKINGEIVLLSVNGKEIAKEDYPKYYPVIDALEQGIKKSKADALKTQEQQSKLLLHKQEALKQHQAALDNKNQALKQQLSKLPSKEHWRHADSLSRIDHLKQLENIKKLKQHILETEKQMKLTYNQKLKDYNESKKLFNQDKVKRNQIRLNTDETLVAIIADILANKLAESVTNLSFTLNANEFVVNGVKVDQGFFEIFKKKYIKNSGDSLIHERNGTTIRTTINIQ
jgi:bla regulator protein BlaR1